MRWGRLQIGFLALFLACTPKATIHDARVGQPRTEPAIGVDMGPNHFSLTLGVKGMKQGYYVMKSPQDWSQVWDGLPGNHPNPPEGVDYSKQMVLIATGSARSRTVEIDRVIKDKHAVRAYVHEVALGEKCPLSPDDLPRMDVVAVPVHSGEIHFYVDHEVDDQCGEPPKTIVECAPKGGALAVKGVTATPGQEVECDMSKSESKAGGIVDRNWFMSEVPQGSFSKIKISEDKLKVTFTTDAYGTYKVRGEVSDPSGRFGHAQVDIDVHPPKDGYIVQANWGNYDINKDDPTKFPKIELHVVEMGSAMGSAKDCTVDKKAPFCDAATFGFAQEVIMRPEEKKRYRVYVKYIEERSGKGAAACVRVLRLAKLAIDRCENDTTVRKAGTTWDVGVIDFDTNNIVDPSKIK